MPRTSCASCSHEWKVGDPSTCCCKLRSDVGYALAREAKLLNEASQRSERICELEDKLAEAREKLNAMTTVRAHGCDCSDDEACEFVRERNISLEAHSACERELDSTRASLAKAMACIETLLNAGYAKQDETQEKIDEH